MDDTSDGRALTEGHSVETPIAGIAPIEWMKPGFFKRLPHAIVLIYS
jgi:hypothetical protein